MAISAKISAVGLIFTLVALAQVRRYPRLATLEFIADLLENPDIETVWVDEPLHRAAIKLLMARQDLFFMRCC